MKFSMMRDGTESEFLGRYTWACAGCRLLTLTPLFPVPAGDESLFKESEPAFSKMAKRWMHLGATGAGARMKLVVNMVMGSMMGKR